MLISYVYYWIKSRTFIVDLPFFSSLAFFCFVPLANFDPIFISVQIYQEKFLSVKIIFQFQLFTPSVSFIDWSRHHQMPSFIYRTGPPLLWSTISSPSCPWYQPLVHYNIFNNHNFHTWCDTTWISHPVRKFGNLLKIWKPSVFCMLVEFLLRKWQIFCFFSSIVFRALLLDFRFKTPMES